MPQRQRRGMDGAPSSVSTVEGRIKDQLEGKKYKALGCKGKDAAMELIKKTENAA